LAARFVDTVTERSGLLPDHAPLDDERVRRAYLG
jgi:hypothetical protein